VVKEERILHFVSGYRRFTLVPIANDEKSSLVAETDGISNLKLVEDISKILEFIES
jgi:hypothetical protein